MGLPFCDILQTFHHPLPGLQFTFSILESDILFFLHFPSSSLPQKLLKRIFISTLNGLPSAPQSHGPCEMCHLGHHRLLVAPRKGTPPSPHLTGQLYSTWPPPDPALTISLEWGPSPSPPPAPGLLHSQLICKPCVLLPPCYLYSASHDCHSVRSFLLLRLLISSEWLLWSTASPTGSCIPPSSTVKSAELHRLSLTPCTGCLRDTGLWPHWAAPPVTGTPCLAKKEGYRADPLRLLHSWEEDPSLHILHVLRAQLHV